jgi:hypothetical protein
LAWPGIVGRARVPFVARIRDIRPYAADGLVRTVRTMSYDTLLGALAIDLAAIITLTYGVYFRRHHRRDLTLGFIGVNVGLFAVASFISTRPLGLALGIGLFALLSVIRLRSTQITQEEIGYYFVAVVIGLVTGLSPDQHWGITATLTGLLVGVMFVADHPRVLPRRERRLLVLDKVYRDNQSLERALAKKLHGEITNVIVLSVDYGRNRTEVDVRFRPHPYPRPHRPHPDTGEPDEQPAEATPAIDGPVPASSDASGADFADAVEDASAPERPVSEELAWVQPDVDPYPESPRC